MKYDSNQDDKSIDGSNAYYDNNWNHRVDFALCTRGYKCILCDSKYARFTVSLKLL